MRVELQTPTIDTRPGQPARASVLVQNTTDVIDGISARAIGLDPSAVRAQPASLPLFPGADGTIDLEFRLPRTFPAGDHLISIELASSANPELVEHVDVQVQVPPYDDVQLNVRPRAVTGKKRAEIAVTGRNDGNTPVEMTLLAADTEHAVHHEFDPPFLSLAPGEEAISILRLEGRRPFSGANAIRRVTVTGVLPHRQLTAALTFSQLPRIRRAPITLGILAAILGLWALLFTLAINNAIGAEPARKEFPVRSMELIGAALAADSPQTGAALAWLGADALSARAVGSVVASTDGEPVGRVTIEAFRQTSDGPDLVTSAATADDGTYELSGLVGGSYKLRFSAPGFEPIWFPASPSESGAEVVRIASSGSVEDLDVEITGLSGGIGGVVDTGDETDPTPVTVTVRAVVGGVVDAVVTEVVTDPLGNYSIPGLATPGTYDISFTADGFEPISVRERLDGGEVAIANTVRLTAGPGSISGRVTADGVPLGGVQIRAMSGADIRATATPTSGAIGTFDLSDLPTPGTYVLSFTRDGYGDQTIAIELRAGQSRHDLVVSMAGGTGTVTGRVTGPDGAGIGDVTVTVSGGPSSAGTTTLTAGEVGGYRLTGLPSPARYTLTFSAPGFRSETIGVELTGRGSATGVDVSLVRSVGSISGTIRDASSGTPLAAVTIDATEGVDVRTARSASSPPGRYTVTNLAAGAWSLTFSLDGYWPQTVLVDLAPGQTPTVDVQLTPR